jgi:hypothetical protein
MILLEFIGASRSYHLMQMEFGGGARSSVNSCKTYIQMWLCSQTHLNPRERLFIPNYQFYRADRFPGRKGVPHSM